MFGVHCRPSAPANPKLADLGPPNIWTRRGFEETRNHSFHRRLVLVFLLPPFRCSIFGLSWSIYTSWKSSVSPVMCLQFKDSDFRHVAATTFVGYVVPAGHMSVWEATVNKTCVSLVPYLTGGFLEDFCFTIQPWNVHLFYHSIRSSQNHPRNLTNSSSLEAPKADNRAVPSCANRIESRRNAQQEWSCRSEVAMLGTDSGENECNFPSATWWI